MRKPIDEMYMDEFIHALAQARYMEEIEENMLTRAIAKAFPSE